MVDTDIEKLIELAREQCGKLSPEEQQRERRLRALDFTYGNLACSTNHKPHRSHFRKLFVDEMKWFAGDEFDAWAASREWKEDGDDRVPH